ncbi:MAG: excinuclease ABC subunit UvrA [Chloroflexota bacterium]|nr:excinuclease ABC subunit UvrA [Dehalococcoidia bacterium]MDW8253121.1 excinuclease ABC subunit UvrA [Chloroflexota bacterium]
MPLDRIVVRGAREHNLKNIDVEIPRDKLVVITGLSGSGKSSLAFDTIYAEGQRRYVESLSAYARQFLGQMEKPDVDHIDGLSPAISIDQKGASRNPRSTVGTITEVYDYLRLLFARVGRPHCPVCGRAIARQTVQQIVDALAELPSGTRILILGPLVKDRKGEHVALLDEVRKQGFVRVRVDGQMRDLSEPITLDKNKRHTIEVVVDRLVIQQEDGVLVDAARLADSVETALKIGEGVMIASVVGGEELLFSERLACPEGHVSLAEIAPRTFSFNSPHGACPDCTGLGTRLEIDPDLVVPDPRLSIADGAIVPYTRRTSEATWYRNLLGAVAEHIGFSLTTPWAELSDEARRIVLYGTGPTPIVVRYRNAQGRVREYTTTYEGVIPNLERRYRETDSDWVKQDIEQYMTTRQCPTCRGKRLRPEALAVRVGGKNIDEVVSMSIADAICFFTLLSDERPADGPPLLTERERAIAHQILKEIRSRLGFLMDVGLDYLTLDRPASSLSGGEAQRIRLATQIGSGLMGVLYICDEPSIGLHPVDGERLIRTLKRLRDLGNTLLIVEHDEAMIRAADYIIDMGPGAGEFGGEVVATGTPDEIMANPRSLTGQYLSGAREIPVPATRRRPSGRVLEIRGAREHNLRNIDVTLPLGLLVCITGVSGSGKSTLIHDILYRKLAQTLYRAKEKPGAHTEILGIEHLDKVVNVDQSPIGRTPRSNPATYTGAFTAIRELFAQVPEARARGYGPGRFSFNVKGGRCEACKGEGYVEIEMHFLPDITIPCEVCKGKRYNREALEVRYKGKSIADVLDMTVTEALAFFDAVPALRNKLQTLFDVGLGYIRLGQPATTLSGGEAQRVKLATELSRRATGRTLYVLDEPTTGLSFEDCAALLRVLQRLVDAGNTVLLIEHNLDMIKAADWIIDLGPGGGTRGGTVVAVGTPEEVAANPNSYTGQFLAKILRGRARTAVGAR